MLIIICVSSFSSEEVTPWSAADLGKVSCDHVDAATGVVQSSEWPRPLAVFWWGRGSTLGLSQAMEGLQHFGGIAFIALHDALGGALSSIAFYCTKFL